MEEQQQSQSNLTDLALTLARQQTLRYVAIAIIVVLLIIAILAVIIGIFGGSEEDEGGSRSAPTTNEQNFFTVFKSGPTKSENGTTLTYTITTSYTVNEAKTRITDFIPEETEFVSASDPYTTVKNASGKVTEVSWEVPVNQVVTITLRPLKNDVAIANRASATIVGSSTSTNAQGPNNNSCEGRWPINNPLGNFGDPSCTFTKDKLYAALKQQDPKYVEEWYRIARCESIDHNPNAYNPGAVDSAGAWGLFQMGRGRNGDFDHGDVVWEQQVTNAILYNNLLLSNGRGWQYWECAKQIGLW